jgi:hypothetical protein
VGAFFCCISRQLVNKHTAQLLRASRLATLLILSMKTSPWRRRRLKIGREPDRLLFGPAVISKIEKVVFYDLQGGGRVGWSSALDLPGKQRPATELKCSLLSDTPLSNLPAQLY